MDEYSLKLDKFLIPIISNIKKPIILELGVENGISTKKFLKLCKNNDGRLFSVDINDCSKVLVDSRWKFFQSLDDNFEFIKKNIPNKLDVIFIDTTHEANHVEKIIYGYYNFLKVDGYMFIDDISHLPYLKNAKRNKFYCEVNNKETFERILEIYNSNKNKFNIEFSFFSSGLAIIKKKTHEELDPKIKIISRENSLKNILRKLWKRVKS